jgi:outer membrane murein-binding lipoprotein Lpp
MTAKQIRRSPRPDMLIGIRFRASRSLSWSHVQVDGRGDLQAGVSEDPSRPFDRRPGRSEQVRGRGSEVWYRTGRTSGLVIDTAGDEEQTGSEGRAITMKRILLASALAAIVGCAHEEKKEAAQAAAQTQASQTAALQQQVQEGASQTAALQQQIQTQQTQITDLKTQISELQSQVSTLQNQVTAAAAAKPAPAAKPASAKPKP